ncbi:hypothetical protein FRC19_005927 [Serendipita sp. 401]|nr:hypothetical protein FRC19_005927 [Serendipita sp. 401]
MAELDHSCQQRHLLPLMAIVLPLIDSSMKMRLLLVTSISFHKTNPFDFHPHHTMSFVAPPHRIPRRHIRI